ncbi:hypothetical protein [Microbacterium sp. NPDC080220]|uniref:hypothetical protein n=1 Tax=Microbacterium sp. NPDC080220 TaxID=3161017 RepID=UPI00342B242F
MAQVKEQRLTIIKRRDGKYGWSLYGDNGTDIIATDGGQGYENYADALTMARKVTSGHYASSPLYNRDDTPKAK